MRLLKTTFMLTVLTLLLVLLGQAWGGRQGMILGFGLAVLMNGTARPRRRGRP